MRERERERESRDRPPRAPAVLALILTGAFAFSLTAMLFRTSRAETRTSSEALDANADFLAARAVALRQQARDVAEIEQLAAAMSDNALAMPLGDARMASSADRAAWTRFPRTRFTIAPRLVRRPDSLVAGELFRNADLNPNDRYVADEARDALELLLAGYQHEIANATRLSTHTARRELDLLIDAGRATTLAHERLLLSRPADGIAGWTEKRRKHLLEVARQRGLDISKTKVLDMDRITGRPVLAWKITAAGIHSANIRELPMTRRVQDVRTRLIQDLGEAIIAWARGLVLLDASAHARLSQEISNECAASIARREGI